MTKTELKLWIALIDAEKEIDDANPDVGMGPSVSRLLDRAWNRTGISLTGKQYDDILREYRKAKKDT